MESDIKDRSSSSSIKSEKFLRVKTLTQAQKNNRKKALWLGRRSNSQTEIYDDSLQKEIIKNNEPDNTIFNVDIKTDDDGEQSPGSEQKLMNKISD